MAMLGSTLSDSRAGWSLLGVAASRFFLEEDQDGRLYGGD
jgi:hypothetical protein